MYYTEHYSDFVDAQNARNEKTRHTERNRTVGDLLKNSKTCPEETIYQIGTVEESVPPEVLFQIVNEFYGSLSGVSALMSISSTGRFIWMRVRPISTNAMYSTARTGTANYVPSRKRRWRNWGFPCLTRISQKASITTASRPLIPSAAPCSLTSAGGMASIWSRSRPMGDGSIWKSRTIS